MVINEKSGGIKMNLQKLFETQKVLRDRIGYKGEDRFEKLILALQVEVGECANEWRGFKFWSKDQEPRVKVPATGWGEPYKNLLLEEYVDGLHFVLEIGLEINYIEFRPIRLISVTNNITQQFKSIFKIASELDLSMLLIDSRKYQTLFNNYLLLGEMLGFTWEEIETAYFEKNKVNHIRQDTGY
jgi:dimeric dUTPase (all-alpha-NTP-PPase superfamily)